MSNVIERIESKLDKSAGQDGCWIWLGAVGQKGGPRTTIGRRSANPRRLIWEFIHGEALPATRLVSTSCKEPRCLNPAHLYLKPYKDDAARFWAKVRKADGEACWEWLGAFDKGYGQLSVLENGAKVMRRAHRVAWELTNGPIVGHVPGHPEKEILVMHKCDNPKCVRPDHLELGTDATNIADMWSKGRGSRGPAHAAACAAGKRRAAR